MSGPLHTWIVATAAVYVAVLLGIGWWSARRTRDARDFFIAGQRVGLLATGLATMSAAFSGFVFLGGPGLTYRIGLGSLMIVLPLGFTAGLLCWVVGQRLRALASDGSVLTVPDAVHARYGSRVVTALAAVAVLAGTVAYLALQLQALGLVVQSIFGGTTMLPALLTGLVIVLAYSVVGGMVAGVYTDVFQGGLMLTVALVIFARALQVCGGWTEMLQRIGDDARFGPDFLDPLGRVPTLTAFGFFFVFGIGVLGQPQMLHKFYMLADPRKLRWLPLVLGGSQAVCVLIWLGVGLAVPALVARGELEALADPDLAMPTFLLRFTPRLVAALAFSGLMAAIMSTADSLVNIGSAALVRDLPRALGLPVRDDVGHARVALLLIGVVAALLAWGYGDLIAVLGTFAFGTFAAALTPALAVGLNWSRVGAPAAGASIATGLLLTPALELLDKQTLWPALPRLPFAAGVVPAAVALAASFTVLFVVTAASREPGRRGTAE